ncbi:MAG: TylF/MycF family methyltransferase [Myxococcales bacterium]|jgi:O-methyltransferase|nr:TylF/MycF family methyltransferase [Myxococcales bacterium]
MTNLTPSPLPLWKHRPRRKRAPPLLFGTRGPGSLYRRLKSLGLLATRDRAAALAFLFADYPDPFPLAERIELIARFVAATNAIRCYHTQAELFVVADALLRMGRRPGLTVVEAGVAKAASSAKLSLVVSRLGGTLHLFDSFRGIPHNGEKLTRLDGSPVEFFKGAFTGRVPTVTQNLQRFGCPRCCVLHKGLFEETLPAFEPGAGRFIDLALLDVDLLSSTRTCLTHLFPKLRLGGAIFTQDGHIREVVELLGSARFWIDEVGVVSPPRIEGLGKRKLLKIVRES